MWNKIRPHSLIFYFFVFQRFHESLPHLDKYSIMLQSESPLCRVFLSPDISIFENEIISKIAHGSSFISNRWLNFLSNQSIEADLLFPSPEWILDSFPSAGEPLRILANLYALERIDGAWMGSVFLLDKTPVFLADGSSLTRKEAERKLAQKEEKKSFAPLRRAMETAERKAWPALENVLDRYRKHQHEFSIPSAHEKFVAAAETLGGFLKRTQDLSLECVRLLMGPNGNDWQSREEFARLLDGVDEDGGFSDAAARALAGAMRNSAEKRTCRPIVRVRSPRAMAGHVITQANGPVRLLHAETRRGEKFLNLLEGGATGILAALFPRHALTGSLDDAIRTLGHVFAMGAHLPLVRRSALDESLAKARQNGRRAAAMWFLHFRCDAALALALCQAEQNMELPWSDLLRETVSGALDIDCDPNAMFWQLKRLPPWPGAWWTLDVLDARLDSLAKRAQAASLFFPIRDRYDEVFPLMSAPFEQIADSGLALAERVFSLPELYDAPFRDDGLVDWISEFLSR